MKKSSITILAIVTVAILAAAVFSTRKGDSGSASAGEDGALLPGLAERLNDVGSLRLVQGDKQVTVELRDVGWGVAERSHYPAKFENLKATVLQLADLDIIEPKTAKAELHAKLGLEEPTEPGATSTLVEILDRSGGNLASLVLSKPSFKGQKQEYYARRTDNPQSYACSGSRMSLNADPLTWIDRELIRLDDDRVFRAEIVHADGETLVVERSSEANDKFLIQDMPEGKKESYAGIANSFATSLSYLRLEDVKRAEDVDLTIEPVAKATFTTYDGLVLEIEMAKFEDGDWIRVVPSFDPEDVPEGEHADAIRAKQEEAAKEVRKYERNLGPWAYKLPEAKAVSLAKRVADFVVDVEPPPPLIEAPEEDAMTETPAAADETVDGTGETDSTDG